MGRRSKEESIKAPARRFAGGMRSPEGIARAKEALRIRQQKRRAEQKGVVEEAQYHCQCGRNFTTQRGISAHRTWVH